MIKLTQLGNGGGIDLITSSAFLIQYKNKKLLFDCGYEIVKELEKIDKNIYENLYIFISHMHEDHIANLHLLLYRKRYLYNIKTPQKIFCGEKIKEELENYLKITNFEKLCEICTNERKLEKIFKFNVKFVEVKHIIAQCYGIAIRTKENKGIVITGDTIAFKNFEQTIKEFFNFDIENILIFHDFTFKKEENIPHANIHQIEREYSEDFRKKLIFYHTGKKIFKQKYCL